MSAKRRVPELRFRGFSGEWEVKKFGACVLIQRGGSPRPIENFITNDENAINWIKIGDVSTASRYITKTKQKIIKEGEKHSRNVYKGDLILSNSMSFGRPYIMEIDGCIHDGWLLIRDEKNMFNLEYLLQLLSSDYMINQYKALAAGGVVINLNSELVQSTNVFIPDVKEQTKIGNYFQNLDKLIEQKEKKYQKLKQLKKAMLEKMFPKEGATTPEIRFQGFSGEWEEKSLGKLSEYKNGKGHEDKQKASGKYELINLNSISINGGLKHSGKFIDETNITLNKNDLVMVLSDVGHGDLLGRVALIPENNRFVLNQRVALLRPQENIIPLFLFYNINAHQKYFKLQGAGMSQLNISRSSVEDFISYFPLNLHEQTKIGNYFQKLDHLIDLQNQELQKLKNIKKASLAKMFV